MRSFACALVLFLVACAVVSAAPRLLFCDGTKVERQESRLGSLHLVIDEESVSLDNSLIRWRIIVGRNHEFYAWRRGWRLLVSSAPEHVSENPLNITNPPVKEAYLVEYSPEKAVVELRSSSKPLVTTRVELKAGERFFRIEHRADFPASIEVESLWGDYYFQPGGRKYADYRLLDLVWTPLLRSEENQVIGEHVFRSPAIVLQEGHDAVILMPDLDTIAASTGKMRSCLDLEVEDASGMPRFGYGLKEHRVQTHVSYRHEPGMTRRLGPGSVAWAEFLYLDAGAVLREAHRVVSRFTWERWGRRFMADTRPQTTPFEHYTRCGFDNYCFTHLWREFELNGKKVGGSVTGAFGGKDIWFQGWFNNLRTAYGLNLWGKRIGETRWIEKSNMVRELILSVPRNRGIFPTLYDTNAKQWINSCGRGAPVYHYHTLDCSWTAYWLLRWEQDIEHDPRVVPFCREYADFLLKEQLPSGAIPSWFDEALMPREIFRECAETTASGLFLAELYRVTKVPRYLAAAKKASDYVTREVVPEHKWFDFETYFSCSPKPLDFYDRHTQQHPQNNLSIHWAVEMYKTLYQATGEKQYLKLGQSMLDYLSLYQQVWAPPFLNCYGFGGFGVQNTDGEWHDARQAVFATTLADFYELTGQPEYLERAIAAVRASFACMYMPENKEISPTTWAKTPLGNADENYGHGGWDAPAGPSSFDWGPGSGAAGAVYLLQRYGQAFIDIRKKHSFGVDGCTVSNLQITGSRISFNITTNIANIKPVLVRFRGLSQDSCDMTVNGERHRFSRKEMEQGVRLTPLYRGIRHNLPHHFNPAEPWKMVVEGTNTSGRMQLRWRCSGTQDVFKALPMQAAGTSRWEVSLPKLDSLKEDLRLEYYFVLAENGHEITLPSPYPEAKPFRLLISNWMVADCGDDGEAYLAETDGSIVSDWSGGGENDRYADGNAHFVYSFPIPDGTRSVEVQFLENGSGKVTIGDKVLLEEKDEGPGEIQLFQYTLTDPSLWSSGKLSLRFADTNPADGWGPNVAWIRVKATDGR